MDQVQYILLGSFLALISSVVVEAYKGSTSHNEQAKNLKIILKLELKNAAQIIDRVLSGYATKFYFEFKVLTQLKASVDRLEPSREKVIYLDEDRRKEEILACINSLATFHTELYSLENAAWQKTDQAATTIPWNDDYYKSQRQILATMSVDLKSKIQNLLNYLES